MDAAKITEMLQTLLLDTHVLLVLVLIGGLTEAFKRVSKVYGWNKKRPYVILLPMMPEALGMGLAMIPGSLPPALQDVSVVIKLGFGVLAGMVSSKIWKVVVALREKPEPKPGQAPTSPED